MRPGRADITTTRSARSNASSTSCVTSTHRAAVAGPHLLQPLLHRPAGDRVERAERFVEQEHGSRHEERAQQRDPLAHAARRAPRARRVRTRRARTARSARRPAPRASSRVDAGDLGAERGVRQHPPPRHAAGRAAVGTRRDRVARSPRTPSTDRGAARRHHSPAMMRSNVDLPHPLGPIERDELARGHVEVERRRSPRPGPHRRRCGRSPGARPARHPSLREELVRVRVVDVHRVFEQLGVDEELLERLPRRLGPACRTARRSR